MIELMLPYLRESTLDEAADNLFWRGTFTILFSQSWLIFTFRKDKILF